MSKRSHIDGAGDQEEDEGPVMTLGEIIGKQEEINSELDKVLGAADPDSCSYSQGYVPRQVVYSCRTCCPQTYSMFCLGCSEHCHSGHDVIELYTKRNVKCDCGNSKFPSDFECKLTPGKDDTNNNHYSQNCQGIYCVCRKPYPDENGEHVDMYQCIICEDWFHADCLKGWENSNFEEMICHPCVKKLPFIKFYHSKFSYSPDEMEGPSPKKVKKMDSKSTEFCLLNALQGPNPSNAETSVFFESNSWRQNLCTCSKCKEMYSKEKIEFLLSHEDTLEAHEEKGSQLWNSSLDQICKESVKDYPHSVQLEFFSRVKEMQEQMRGFIQEMSEKGKVVTSSDVMEFFETLKRTK